MGSQRVDMTEHHHMHTSVWTHGDMESQQMVPAVENAKMTKTDEVSSLQSLYSKVGNSQKTTNKANKYI